MEKKMLLSVNLGIIAGSDQEESAGLFILQKEVLDRDVPAPVGDILQHLLHGHHGGVANDGVANAERA